MSGLKVKSFKFLFKPTSSTSYLDFNLNQLLLTCFDINCDVVVFGSNHGLIYVYKRDDQDTFTLIHQKDLNNGFIKKIHLIDRHSLVLMTHNGFSVVNFIDNFLIYKCQSR